MKVKNVNPKLIALVSVLAAVVVLAGAIWFFTANVIVGGSVYPRGAEFLNLREKELTVGQYNAIREKLPNCEIYWSIPFQGKTYPENTVELTVTTLSDADLTVLDYFTKLQVVRADGCTNYAQLAALQAKRPDVVVQYTVTIDGKAHPQNTRTLPIANGITDEEIALVQYLPALERVNADGCTDYGQLGKLQNKYPELAVNYSIAMCGEKFSTGTEELVVTGMTAEEGELLRHFHSLTKIHISEPEMAAWELRVLIDRHSDVEFSWEKTILGVLVHSDDTVVDFTPGISEEGALAFEMAKHAKVMGKRDDTVWQFVLDYRYPIPNKSGETWDLMGQVERGLSYFPNIEEVYMNGAFLDNNAMSEYREKHREDFKLVWTVQLGTMAARTDTPYFMPYKYHVAYFFDDYAYNLRYCEDIVCIDLGHMSVHKADFVEFMPKLKYLILAHTQVKDISPLSNCKSLVFLELDWSIVQDYTPLLGCTALEDLNLSKTFADIDPVLQMTWLKHLWITQRGAETQQKIREAFAETETELYLNGDFTVGGGWRQMENYYAMRDILGMEYMK